MAGRKRVHKPREFTLLRSVNGKIVKPDADIDRALDLSSSSASLAELQQRGYSQVRVVDRAKVASLVRQAVQGERPAHPESRANAQTAAPGSTPADGFGRATPREFDGSAHIDPENLSYLAVGRHGGLADIVAEIVQARMENKQATLDRFSSIEQRMQQLERLVQRSEDAAEHSGGATGTPKRYASFLPASVAAEGAAGRLTSIDQRMKKLEELLRRTERAAEGLAARGAAAQWPFGRRKTTEQQQALLEDLFRQNVQLQALAREAEAAAQAL